MSNSPCQGNSIKILSKQNRYSAIMRGAVLHGLGLNLIKERNMRRSYGITTQPEFVNGVHPIGRRTVSPIDGSIRCKDVMRWYVTKVHIHSPAQID